MRGCILLGRGLELLHSTDDPCGRLTRFLPGCPTVPVVSDAVRCRLQHIPIAFQDGQQGVDQRLIDALGTVIDGIVVKNEGRMLVPPPPLVERNADFCPLSSVRCFAVP